MSKSNKEKRKTTNSEYYDNFVIYKNKHNIDNHIKQMQDFYHGLTNYDTGGKNMFHIRMNIIDLMVRNKASRLNGTPLYLTFTADDNNADCTALRRFDEYNRDKLHIDVENFQSAINGLVNGTEIVFLRWDKDDTSYRGIYKGGLKMEHIDPRCFAVANPNILDVQNQEWVMFWKDESLGELERIVEAKSKKEKDEKIEMLRAEARKSYPDDIHDDKDILSHALVRVYTRYFRKNGEVFFELSTDTVDIFAFPHPLSTRISKAISTKLVEEKEKNTKKAEDGGDGNVENKVIDYDIDFEDMILNIDADKILSEEEYKNEKEKFSLFPFAVFRPIRVNNNFYGRSDVASIANIQLAINFTYSMLCQIMQNTAYNPILAKPDALNGQVVTNEPNQVLYDWSRTTNGWGVKFLETQPMPNGMLTIVDNMINTTRVVYGFSEVMDGSIQNQDMSGFAVQQMIQQSNAPIEQQQKIFWEFNVDMAEIRLMFYKHYVDTAKYTFEMSDGEYSKEEQARKIIYNKLLNGEKLASNPNATIDEYKNPVHKIQTREINKDTLKYSFDISCKAMQGLQESAMVQQQTFDNILLNGGLQNADPEALALWLQASPSISQNVKDEVGRIIDNYKNSELVKCKQQNQELMQKLQQAAQLISQLDASNKKATLFANNLKNEFTNKINNANQMIQGLYEELDKKSQGEVKSANARGISGEHISKDSAQ